MLKGLKKRIFTSIFLLILLSIMFIDNFFQLYILIICGVFALLEFFKMNLIIFKKNKIKYLIFNCIFVLYIFLFCTIFTILSFHFHFKILIFLILLTCVFSDIGGFIFGKIFKGPKLTKISPQKTISGSLGSFLFSIIFLYSAIFYLTKNMEPNILIVGLLTSLGCQIGDLFFSFLKRKSFIKDTGNYLPGHGGVLDRIDGMLLGIPIGLLALTIIY